MAGCARRADHPTGVDPHSYARPDEVRVEHLTLDLTVDFDRRVLEGTATLAIDRARPAARELVLDTRDLTIASVRDAATGVELEHWLGDADPILGRPLGVTLGDETTRVAVAYRTAPEAGALQWLAPEQTAGGRAPFLLTQSQAILARTWIPCQDTPSVRFTYDATIRVPDGLLALMSAENPTEAIPGGVYRFRMPQPIPSYLMALAVGEIAFHPFDERSGVYAEPELIERAAYEFADTPAMIDACEEMFGPYRWGRFDVLVLPPSFPYGGMENPRLTFATPTILAGDRSLTALIAHELAHSWSGNLATNATWDEFWLNEGFTVYLERRIVERIYGRETAEMQAAIGFSDLEEEIARLGADHPDTRLVVDSAGRDPDDVLTDVAYEKGYLFLRRLEEAVGRRLWDPFLRRWFDDHAFQPVTTEEFLERVRAELAAERPEAFADLDLETWVRGTGIPADAPRAHSDAFDVVDAELSRWLAGMPAAELDTASWNTWQWLHFLRGLPDGIPPERLAELDAAFHLTDSGNAEILFAWLVRAIDAGYRAADDRVAEFLATVGRRKFVAPLFQHLAATEEGLERAERIYAVARARYHPVTYRTVDRILEAARRRSSN